MTEQATPEGATPRPVPDLGFFAGAPTGGGSSFGSGSGAVPAGYGGAPTSNQFGSAPAAHQFGSAPAVTPFGTAPAGTAFGAPGQRLAPPAAGRRSANATTKVVAGVVGLVLLAVAVFGGRFVWRHFFADPTLPETLMGAPRLVDASIEAGLREAQESVGAELTAGSEAKVALYTDGQGLGYMLFALRGSDRPGKGGEGDSAPAGWAESKHGNIACFQQPAQADTGLGVTFCVRGFFRRAVVVMAFGLTPPDPAMVARGTEEAWAAQ